MFHLITRGPLPSRRPQPWQPERKLPPADTGVALGNPILALPATLRDHPPRLPGKIK
jgi:hypothetical protein